jgi:integrase
MSLTKYKNSPYYYTRFSIRGIRVQESTGETLKAKAIEYEEMRKQQVRDQLVYGKKPEYTWIQAQHRWLLEHQHKRSIKSDIVHFKYLDIHLNSFQLINISSEVIETIAKHREKDGLTPASVNRMLALIKSVLHKSVKEWEWLDKMPFIRMRKEDNSRIRWLTKEEATRVLTHLPNHLQCLMEFTLQTGLRAGSLLNLKWSYFRPDEKILILPPEINKSGREFVVPLNARALQILYTQMCSNHKKHEYIFLYKNKQIKQCNTKAWRKALKRSGINDFRWHDLRHTWATWHRLYHKTPIDVLQKLGDWSSITMPLRYAHFDTSTLRDVVDKMVETV